MMAVICAACVHACTWLGSHAGYGLLPSTLSTRTASGHGLSRLIAMLARSRPIESPIRPASGRKKPSARSSKRKRPTEEAAETRVHATTFITVPTGVHGITQVSCRWVQVGRGLESCPLRGGPARTVPAMVFAAEQFIHRRCHAPDTHPGARSDALWRSTGCATIDGCCRRARLLVAGTT